MNKLVALLTSVLVVDWKPVRLLLDTARHKEGALVLAYSAGGVWYLLTGETLAEGSFKIVPWRGLLRPRVEGRVREGVVSRQRFSGTL